MERVAKRGNQFQQLRPRNPVEPSNLESHLEPVRGFERGCREFVHHKRDDRLQVHISESYSDAEMGRPLLKRNLLVFFADELPVFGVVEGVKRPHVVVPPRYWIHCPEVIKWRKFAALVIAVELVNGKSLACKVVIKFGLSANHIVELDEHPGKQILIPRL